MTNSERSSALHWPMLAVTLFWGLNIPIVKVTLDEISPLAFASLRRIVAALLMVCLAWATEGAPRFERQDWRRLLALGLLGHFVSELGFILGVAHTTASNSSLILATTPIWVALLGTLGGIERQPTRAWIGIVLSFLGVGLIVQGDDGWGLHLSTGWRGDLLCLGSALSWALYTVWMKPLVTRCSPLWVTSASAGVGAVFLSGTSASMLPKQDWVAISWSGWGGLAYSAVFALVIGNLIWSVFVRRIGSAQTAVYQNIIPAVSILISWIFLGERWVPIQAIGAVLVFAGLCLTGRRPRSTHVEGT